MSNDIGYELRQGKRFAFGQNWIRFSRLLDENRIEEAECSLRDMLGVNSLIGKRMLDVGSGSGLFSLAAKRLGATVCSFDYDPLSVACTAALRHAHYPESCDWRIETGSALDADYLNQLGQFDLVYSWGVLHHTGGMWQALANILHLVRDDGQLFIAVYNDQGWVSRYWILVKRIYNHGPLGKLFVILYHSPYLLGLRFIVRWATGKLILSRGMSLWYDMLDWLGGYPFEVAKPEEIFLFLRKKGFILENLRTCGGRHGCNEFVFRRKNTA